MDTAKSTTLKKIIEWIYGWHYEIYKNHAIRLLFASVFYSDFKRKDMNLLFLALPFQINDLSMNLVVVVN